MLFRSLLLKVLNMDVKQYLDSLSPDELKAELQRQAINEIRMLRSHEYPPIGDQLDALWKGGEEAAAMLAKVQAVKAKYPKGQA